ncbi:MAG TPA: type II secretion system minor pseudopilin GspJ [Steroidobacteraceae bacterium]|jgi:general secretion pathway protein J|nr:type II secretion system minor pseudopilin GspJ [Steroidobacteraceae bacterium]
MRRAGFTLIEVVIAIFIAAIMFAIGYRTLSQALNDREALNTSQARVNEIQRGMRIVAQDFAQIVARGARDTQGNGELQPAISANNRDNVLLTFSRTGWSNPAGLQRPAEERVRYLFVDGSLVREHWVSMDPALNNEPRQRVVLTRVKSIEVRFLDPVTRNWRTDWPPVAPNGPIGPLQVDEVLLLRPLAIEVSLVLEDWGRVRRLFEIPT